MTDGICIIGDGQMGLVLAEALASQGRFVRLWGPLAPAAQALAQTRRSSRLPEVTLQEEVEVTAETAGLFQGCDLVISAIPTQYLRGVWERIASELKGDETIVSVTKGIELSTMLRPTVIIESVLAERIANWRGAVGVLSGPTIAAELARRQPAVMVAAADDMDTASRIQHTLAMPWLRIYSSQDVIGVEIAGAAKNVIALAAGMADGLGLGYNAKSAILARGLAEMARLGVALGAQAATFYGVAGVGDLATTCFCPEGRNRTAGEAIGRGTSVNDALASTASVVEGIPTAKALNELAERLGVSMPIVRVVHDILYEGLSPRAAIDALMMRELKAESVS